MFQGTNREIINVDGYIKDAFLSILNTKSKELNVDIIFFNIMNNHENLLLYTENIHNLTKLMAPIDTIFNKVNDIVGQIKANWRWTRLRRRKWYCIE